MREIAKIFEKIEGNADVAEIRRNIIDLLAEQLEHTRDRLGYWEKMHFANAIAALVWNLRATHQPTTSWLRLSLVNLKKALVPPDQRNENYVPQDAQLAALTYEQLVETIEFARSVA